MNYISPRHACFYGGLVEVDTSLGEEGAGLCASSAFVCLFCTG